MEADESLIYDLSRDILHEERFLDRHELYLKICERLRTKKTGVSLSYGTFISHIAKLVRAGDLYEGEGQISDTPL